MRNSISIVLSGESGQGLQTIEELLVEAVSKFYYVFSTKDVMSRVSMAQGRFSCHIYKDMARETSLCHACDCLIYV